MATHSRGQVYIVHLLHGLIFSQPYHTEKNEAQCFANQNDEPQHLAPNPMDGAVHHGVAQLQHIALVRPIHCLDGNRA